jgi:hypothetical protein
VLRRGAHAPKRRPGLNTERTVAAKRAITSYVAAAPYDVSMRTAASVLIGVTVLTVVFVVASPLGGISGGGPLLLAAVGYTAAILMARQIFPAAKDDRTVWLVLLAVTIALIYVYTSIPGPPGSEGGRAK